MVQREDGDLKCLRCNITFGVFQASEFNRRIFFLDYSFISRSTVVVFWSRNVSRLTPPINRTLISCNSPYSGANSASSLPHLKTLD